MAVQWDKCSWRVRNRGWREEERNRMKKREKDRSQMSPNQWIISSLSLRELDFYCCLSQRKKRPVCIEELEPAWWVCVCLYRVCCTGLYGFQLCVPHVCGLLCSLSHPINAMKGTIKLKSVENLKNDYAAGIFSQFLKPLQGISA